MCVEDEGPHPFLRPGANPVALRVRVRVRVRVR